ncbi:MAG: glutaminyl-peptide cyclotransferase [Acidobacteria bacterium]|nr:glutaminyl-peptide cyclotransferase [Acidobacteriota bacterium]
MSLRISLAVVLCFMAQSKNPRTYGYKVVSAYPHDPGAFTQGLVFHDGYLYEGTGMHGKSGVRKVELKTGKVVQEAPLQAEYFGEGITLWKDKLIQLTWQTRIGFVYDLKTFRLLDSFVYRTEGWGLTHDGKRLILSDGTSVLYFLDPATFKEIGQMTVRDRGAPVSNLNELEYVKGEIWANVWQSERIARIAPSTGQVIGWINLKGLLTEHSQPVDVLNGIAYDAKQDRVFVTGKWWPKLFEIRVD